MDEISAGCRDHGVKHWKQIIGSCVRPVVCLGGGGGGCYHNAPVVFQIQ